MSPAFYIIVSAENTPYMAWQAKLFHFSCVSRTSAVPLIFVHGGAARELDPSYADVVRMGGVVCRAGSFRASPAGDSYAARNTPGTLLSAAELCEDPDALFVLCDPDMLFVRSPTFARRLSADATNFMDYSEPAVLGAAERLGISGEELVARNSTLQCAVPHVIPAVIARPFAETWLDAIDVFPKRGYIDSMYAFALAALSLQLDIEITRHVITDYTPDAALCDADMIHYGYGDARWNKRDYMTAEQIERVWDPPPPSGDATVYGEIARQLREAHAYYEGAGQQDRGVPRCK